MDTALGKLYYCLYPKKLTLHYDYGDDWMFTIHVQKIEDEQRKTNPELIKSVGVLEQYPDYEDWDEYDEF